MSFDFKGRTWNVVYIDPSIATAGDGSAPDQALADLPDFSTIADNTCFLVRRTAETSAITAKTGQTLDSKSMMIIGMPLATDELYTLMPADAKTAWDADTDTHAVMTRDANSIMNVNNIGIFYLDKIKFLALTSGEGTAAWWHSRYSATTGEIFVNDCIVSNLDKGRIRDLSTDVSNTSYPGLLDVYDMWRTSIRNCEFDTSTTGILFYEGIKYIDFIDNEVWSLTGAAQMVNGYYECYRAQIKNIKQHIYVNGNQTSSEGLPGSIQMRNPVTNAFLENIKIDMDSPVLGTFTKTLHMGSYNFSFEGVSDFIMKDCDFDYSKCWNADNRSIYIMTGDMNGDIGDHNHKIENCQFKLAATNGLGTSNGRPSTSDVEVTTGWFYTNASLSRSTMNNVVIHAPRTKALYIAGWNVNNLTLDGAACIQGISGNLTHWGYYYPDTFMRFRSGPDRLYIEEVVANKNNIDHPYVGLPALYDSNINRFYVIVNNCNVPLFNTILNSGGTDNTRNNAISINDAGIVGNYKIRSYNKIIETWNSERDGNPVLRATAIQDDPAHPLIIGRQPSLGIPVTPGATGAQHATIYIAHKNYLDIPALLRNVKVVAIVPASADVNDDTKVYADTLTDGVWEVDSASVYTNDSGLTQLKCVLPINVVTVAKDVYFEFHFAAYSNINGYMYFDPNIVIA